MKTEGFYAALPETRVTDTDTSDFFRSSIIVLYVHQMYRRRSGNIDIDIENRTFGLKFVSENKVFISNYFPEIFQPFFDSFSDNSLQLCYSEL